MLDILIDPFIHYSFMKRALCGCLALSLGATPIGLFLILRRMSLMGEAMSHAILPGTALAYLFYGLSYGAMTIGGVGAGIAVALATGLVARSSILQEDAAMASFYLISLSLGVMLISMKGNNIDLLHVLFGSVLALDDESLHLIASITTFTLCSLALIYRPLVLECSDSEFLHSVSRSGSKIHLYFLILVVINLVSGFNAIGTLLAVGIMILPATASRLWVKTLPCMLILACLIAFLSSIIGLLLSFYMDISAGPAIMVIAGMFYILSILIAPGGSFGLYLYRSKKQNF